MARTLDEIAAKYVNKEKKEVTSSASVLDRIAAKYTKTDDYPSQERETDSNIFAEPNTLRKDDLKTGKNASDIRAYMQARFGNYDYSSRKVDDNQVVEDFFDHMRSFNTNVISTAGEVRFVTQADERKRQLANRAFELYDQTGSVFTNDGFYGAIDGVRDYMVAAATDPSNYIGLITGGLAKAGTVGTSQAGKAAVKTMLMKAGRDAAAKQTTVDAQKKAADLAYKQTMARLAKANVGGKAAKETAKEIARTESKLVRKKLVREALDETKSKVQGKADTKALLATTAIDGTLAMLHDVQIQSVYEEIDPQYQYSVGQTAFSSLFGTVAGGAQLAGRAFRGSSDLGGAMQESKYVVASAENLKKADNAVAKAGKLLTDKQQKKAVNFVGDAVVNWATKVKNGKDIFDEQSTPVELLSEIVLGPNGNGKGGGLVSIFNEIVQDGSEEGMKIGISKDTRISDVLTNVVSRMSQDEIKDINNKLKAAGVDIHVGDMASLNGKIRDLLAKDTSEAGQVLSVWSQARRLTNGALLRADDVAREMAGEAVNREKEKMGRMKGLQYGQNLWRRMLVSSISTSAVNVAGFSQYFVASSLADLFAGGALYAGGIARMGKQGAEMRRMGKVYMGTVAQKARHLLDPFTTHDEYMAFLKENKEVSKVLFETVTGGVERTADRYGIDPKSPFYRSLEAMANGAGNITGVRIQDSFTKSQMFMTEMDKYMKLKHDMSLTDALRAGKMDLIDSDVIGSSLDVTMKSVFSKDYTTDDQLLGQVAKGVESISNMPFLGTILPFGRFMNNTVATAYQWSVGGAMPVMQAIINKEKRNIDTLEAASRSIVGLSALAMAMQYDQQQIEADRPWHIINIGGDSIDVKNHFPFSLFLAVGRVANLRRTGQAVPPELLKDMGQQLAVGQFASDVQFENDLTATLDAIVNEGGEGSRVQILDALYQKSGSFVAGYTRPLDSINKLVGYINNTDAAIDKRQAKGIDRGVLESTKYVKNIVEMFTDKLDNVSGEELRVALREGDIQDINPLSAIFGIKRVPGRTDAEVVYSMAEMHPYMANMRTKVPAFDKIFNTKVAPILEEEANKLLNDPKFLEANLNDQRDMVKRMRSSIRSQLKELMKDYGSEETQVETLRATLITKGGREAKINAKRFMKEQGVEGPMTEWTYRQLKEYEAYMDLQEKYGN